MITRGEFLTKGRRGRMVSMNYQNLLCVGDSQTFGARSYGCYPLHLARILCQRTPYQWRTINHSANGATARDLWFMANRAVERVADTYQACVLIGANDVGNESDLDLFAEYYRQILRAFFVKRYKAVYCGEIPPIHADGHAFFARVSDQARAQYNAALAAVVAEWPRAHLVRFAGLTRDAYEDPVHFNEEGNRRVAEAFAAAILER